MLKSDTNAHMINRCSKGDVILKEREVPAAVVKRLPRYYRYLGELMKKNILRVSSMELSRLLGVTASQIRQDLNCFGGFGQQGYGYNVEMLYNEIERILGLNCGYKTIIIGAGHLGHALASYNGFSKRGFSVIGIFDIDKEIIGTKIGSLEVMDYGTIKSFIEHSKPDIAVLAVPKSSVNDVAGELVDAGIKALWNFAYVDLSLPDDVAVENVHLSDSLMMLSYRLTNIKNEGDA